MENKAFINNKSFHLAGIVPIAGQPLDYNFPWHDSLQPIGKDFLAAERAVWECACAGCETIWIVCHDDMQPLIKYRLGDYVYDPTRSAERGSQRIIPLHFVPIHPNDRDKRDCLGWSVLYGALTAYWLSRTISQWVQPDRYYVSFPYGVYKPELVIPYRTKISSNEPFCVSYDKKTVKDNEYLGFTFDGEDFKECRRVIRKEGTGQFLSSDMHKRMPIEERWSARHFKLDKIFEHVNMNEANILCTPWYYNIDSWDGLCEFLGTKNRKELDRPSHKMLGYHEWNLIGDEIE